MALEVTGWITVNGNHIPIIAGESKMKAVSRFVKGKRKDKREKNKQEWENYTRDVTAANKAIDKHKLYDMSRDEAVKSYNKLRDKWDEMYSKTNPEKIKIKGEGTQAFKANRAYDKQNTVEQSYRKRASDVMDKVNKKNDSDLAEIRSMREKGVSRAKIREAQALMEYNYNRGSSNANLLKLEGNYEGQKAYNNYMDKPMKFKLNKAKTRTRKGR